MFQGVRGHAPPEKFTHCNGYFSAFSIIFRKILFKLFYPNSECFAKYHAFCSHILIMRALDVRLVGIEEVRNYRKIVCIKNIFENG